MRVAVDETWDNDAAHGIDVRCCGKIACVCKFAVVANGEDPIARDRDFATRPPTDQIGRVGRTGQDLSCACYDERCDGEVRIRRQAGSYGGRLVARVTLRLLRMTIR